MYVPSHVTIIVENSSGALVPVVRKLDSAIHWINRYPEDKHYDNQLRYPLDSAILLSNNWGLKVMFWL